MISGLTRQEQRVLILLLAIITLGLTIDYYKSSRKDRSLWIEIDNHSKSLNNSRFSTVPNLSTPAQNNNLLLTPPPASSSFYNNVPTPQTPTKININTASTEQLMTLDQIGEILANRIIEHRQRFGPFLQPHDLMNVKGIGKTRFELNKDKIIVK